ncbi:MAG: enoyl-CoA hydratase/isomerase family protein [Solirubrobacteraceae bacterium]
MRFVSIEEHHDVAVVRVDRPPANAMDPGLLADAVAATEDIAAAEPAAVVLTGRPGFFSAGADLKVVPTLDADGQRAMVDGINGLCMAWYGLPRPVVCAVNGHAIAGGLVFALCADYRVAAADGRYGLTELRAGVPYPTMAIAVVAAELSAPAARRLVLRADLVDAADLRELGAFDEVVPNDEVLDRALAVARDLAALPSSAYAATKRRLRAPTLALAARLQAGEADPLGDAWTDADTASRAAAILRGG